MKVSLVVEAGPYAGLSRADIARRAGAMLTAAGERGSELSVVLTNDQRIQELNRVYRKKDRPTDVLAFAQRDGALAPGSLLLGDVIVSVPTAARQATAAGHSLLSEVTMLLAHGILHLLGWDHDTPSKDRQMRRETARLCSAASAVSRRVRRS